MYNSEIYSWVQSLYPPAWLGWLGWIELQTWPLNCIYNFNSTTLVPVTKSDSLHPQLQGCACSNVVGLIGTLLAFFLYCYSLSTLGTEGLCEPGHYGCPMEILVVSGIKFSLLILSFLGSNMTEWCAKWWRLGKDGCLMPRKKIFKFYCSPNRPHHRKWHWSLIKDWALA